MMSEILMSKEVWKAEDYLKNLQLNTKGEYMDEHIQKILKNEIEALEMEIYSNRSKPTLSSIISNIISRCVKLVPPMHRVLRMFYYSTIRKELRIPNEYTVSIWNKYYSLLTVQELLRTKTCDDFFDEESMKILKEFFRKRLLCAFNDKIPYKKLFTKEDIQKQRKIFKIFVENYKMITPHIYEFMGFKTILPHFDPSVFIEKYGICESNITDNPIIIDCGAYIGDTVFMFKSCTLNPVIVAVEPSSTNFQVLRKNIEINRWANVIPLNVAVGAEEGRVDLLGDGRADAKSKKGSEIRLTTIDKIIEEMGLNKLDIIKMDIEGFELDALVGAKETLKRFKPLLLISVYHRGGDIFEIPKLIKEVVPDYRMKLKHLNPFSPTDEYTLICERREERIKEGRQN